MNESEVPVEIADGCRLVDCNRQKATNDEIWFMENILNLGLVVLLARSTWVNHGVLPNKEMIDRLERSLHRLQRLARRDPSWLEDYRLIEDSILEMKVDITLDIQVTRLIVITEDGDETFADLILC